MSDAFDNNQNSENNEHYDGLIDTVPKLLKGNEMSQDKNKVKNFILNVGRYLIDIGTLFEFIVLGILCVCTFIGILVYSRNIGEIVGLTLLLLLIFLILFVVMVASVYLIYLLIDIKDSLSEIKNKLNK